MGKVCHLYFTRDHTIFLHNLLNGDGVQSIAQFRKEALFDNYRISSQNDDRIAFTIDLSLLQRAIRSSVSIYAEMGGGDDVGTGSNRLQIKLVKKLPPNSHQPLPFLTFESKGYKSAVIQDVPISKPLSRADVLELQSALDMAQDLPRTLVQVPDLNQLQNYVDRMKHVGICLTSPLANMGIYIHGPRGQFRGDAQTVQVSMKHFAKSLQCHLAKPDCAFYGIAQEALHCRLPVLDPGSS
ncbi:hypothetical protein AAG906_029684 [Vitis piasezkii]